MGRAREIADLIGGTTPDIILKTSDGAILNLQTSDTTVTADSVLGAINFQAPDEADGTDSILIASKIEAIAEGTFAADNNATKLVFSTGASEAAAAKMTLSSGGVLDVDGGITIDNITIDGTEIDLSSGDLTVDVAGDITLDAGGGDIIFSDDGTQIGRIRNVSSGEFTFNADVQDKDMVFNGNDGGTTVTALTFDMSANGAAHFGASINVGSATPGSETGSIFSSSSDLIIQSNTSDKDIKFQVNDGGSTGTLALFLDAHEAGTFRNGSIGTANPGSGSEGTIIVNGQGGILITGGSSGNTTALRIYSTNSAVTTAAISALGALSKTSGSFKIKHPLPSKTETHHLVHSFVEAPEAANIYRGKVALSSGTATVNLDTSSGMSEGSFESLNRDVQCFTSNETGWTAVKGAVSFLSYDFQLEDGSGSLVDESGNTLITEGVHSNILTITAQDNSCTDTISWLVVGQRHDSHMYETDWTDTHGRVIVEPLQIPKEEYDYRLGK